MSTPVQKPKGVFQLSPLPAQPKPMQENGSPSAAHIQPREANGVVSQVSLQALTNLQQNGASPAPQNLVKELSLSPGLLQENAAKPTACQFKYVVNAPIPYKSDAQVKASIETVMKCCEEMQAGDPSREFCVCIGLNLKEDRDHRDADLRAVADRLQRELLATYKGKVQLQIAGFTWTPLSKPPKSPNTPPVNYVDLRNRLFYHEKTQAAIARFVDAAKKDPAQTVQVKLLSMDCDTAIPKYDLSRLERRWQENEAPLVTSGCYQFSFGNVPTALVTDGSQSVHWEGFLERHENRIDCQKKIELCTKTFPVPITYEKLKNQKGADLLDLARRNIQVLSSVKTGDAILGKILLGDYQNLEKFLKVKLKLEKDKSDEKGRDQILRAAEANITAELEKIKRKEMRLSDREAAALKGVYPLKGEQFLYPSENALFVSLYEQRPKLSYNLFETSCAYGPKSNKSICLWGNTEGASEGQNLAVQIKRLWYKTKHEGFSCKYLEFPWVFKTAVPTRCLDISRVLEELPETTADLRRFSLDKCRHLAKVVYQSKSQSCLNGHWPKQRVFCILGKKMGDDKIHGLVPRAFRFAAANYLQSQLEAIQAQAMEEALALVTAETARVQAKLDRR